ncbi:MAG: ABC transporter permease [Ruminococcus sp.]|nr:ABC transporter permease [Ruminococcus sp.]
MGNRYYARLAADNIKKNARVYVPYIISCVLMAAMIYIISSLANNPDMSDLKRGATVTPIIMRFGTYVTMVFAFIFIFYSNSFIVKRRRKEFGLLNILGMEKRHIAKLLLIENVYVIAIALTAGLGCGVLLDKLMSLSLTRLLGESVILGFHISVFSLVLTGVFLLATFLVIYIYTLGQIHLAKPVELLSGSSVGEKEPKTKLFMALLGAALLAVGYYISIVTQEPTKVLPLFLLAVLCVVFGTYLLFMAGSIALLKYLKKRERFYYKTNHFAAVSGLIYRMKRNAVGLASVCILSTMVLVMVSVTSSMMLGLDGAVRRDYPTDVILNAHDFKAVDRFEEYLREKMDVKNVRRVSQPVLVVYGDLENPTMFTKDDYNKLTDEAGEEFEALKEEALAKSYNINVFEKDEVIKGFNEDSALRDEDYDVAKGEVVVVTGMEDLKMQSITIAGKSYKVANVIFNRMAAQNGSDWGYDIVMNSREEIVELERAYNERSYKECLGSEMMFFDYVSSDKQAQNEAFEQIFAEKWDEFEQQGNMTYTFFTDMKAQAMGVFGSLFFLGLFLGTLFIAETILIIYYKQISEGYEDQKRFEIMQNVGMSRREVKHSIRSQILMVFFLPLIVAGVHIVFAFPLIKRLLYLLGLSDTMLYVLCAAGGFVGFALIYTAIYSLTAKTYYKIVKK